MPLSLDPTATVDYWLESDKDIPADKRPTFICKFLTKRQVSKMLTLWDEFQKSTEDVSFDILWQIISLGVVGWRNFPTAYSKEALEDALTVRELLELANDYPNKVRLGELDRKNSSSPLPTAAA